MRNFRFMSLWEKKFIANHGITLLEISLRLLICSLFILRLLHVDNYKGYWFNKVDVKYAPMLLAHVDKSKKDEGLL
jgi:hypothetical protein